MAQGKERGPLEKKTEEIKVMLTIAPILNRDNAKSGYVGTAFTIQ